MKKKFISVAAGLLLALPLTLLAAGCGGKNGQELKVGIMPDVDSIPFVVAYQNGYLPDNIVLDLYKSPVDRDSALYSSNLDGTISDVLAVCIANDGGFRVFITSKTNGAYGLLTNYSDISSAKDLEGKTIGLSLNTIIEYVTDRILDNAGADKSTVEKIAVPKIPSRLELLATNQIDAICVPEPYVTAASASGSTIVSTSVELSINPGVLLFTENAVDGKASEIKSLKTAYDKAVDYIAKHDNDDFMMAVIEYLGLPETAIDVNLPDYQKWTLPDEAEVESAISWLNEKSMLTGEYTYSDLVIEIK